MLPRRSLRVVCRVAMASVEGGIAAALPCPGCDPSRLGGSDADPSWVVFLLFGRVKSTGFSGSPPGGGALDPEATRRFRTPEELKGWLSAPPGRGGLGSGGGGEADFEGDTVIPNSFVP